MTITNPNLLDILEKIASHIKCCDNCSISIIEDPYKLSENVHCYCGKTWEIPYYLKRSCYIRERDDSDCSYVEFISSIRWLSNSASVASIKSGELVLNRPSPSLPSDVIAEQFEKESECVAQNSIEYLEL